MPSNLCTQLSARLGLKLRPLSTYTVITWPLNSWAQILQEMRIVTNQRQHPHFVSCAPVRRQLCDTVARKGEWN